MVQPHMGVVGMGLSIGMGVDTMNHVPLPRHCRSLTPGAGPGLLSRSMPLLGAPSSSEVAGESKAYWFVPAVPATAHFSPRF